MLCRIARGGPGLLSSWQDYLKTDDAGRAEAQVHLLESLHVCSARKGEQLLWQLTQVLAGWFLGALERL